MSQITKTNNISKPNKYPQQNKSNKLGNYQKPYEKDIVVTVITLQTDHKGQILDIRA
jgi:hypothetical protein